jgi:hypothetical protein
MDKHHPNGSPRQQEVERQVAQMLAESPHFRQLDGATQASLKESLARITGYLASSGVPQGLAGQLAPPSLQQRLSPQGGNRPAQAAPNQAAPSAPAASTAPSQGATGRVGDVTRATLNAINFPEFVASLIKGTFQAIVDASIQQMEAYAELLKNVATTVDRFMGDNISEDVARDYLADQHDGFLVRDTTGGRPRLRINPQRRSGEEMPSFFKDLGFESPDDIDDDALEQVAVPAARRSLAERRQQTLATMVLMGINRIVVDEGDIKAKLQFHIDASETTNLRFDQQKTTVGNIARGGSSPFTANGIMVNTTSLNAQSDINVRTDLTGEVRVKFRSETFPLERFADSIAIQLINQNAKVPQPAPAPGAAPQPAPQQAPPAAPPAAPPPAPPPAATAPRPPAAQSLDAAVDPWAPEAAAQGGGYAEY